MCTRSHSCPHVFASTPEDGFFWYSFYFYFLFLKIILQICAGSSWQHSKRDYLCWTESKNNWGSTESLVGTYFLFIYLFLISFTPMRTLPSTYIYQNDDVTQVWTSWRSAGRWHRDPGGNKARLVLP